MKALIVEDKAYIRKGLINLLETFETDVEIIGECASVKEAVVVSEACKPDLVFLDINLTDGTGFDFLDQTEHLSYKIIFITAYEEYALQALKIGAVDYLLKPVDVGELETALEKVKSLPLEEQKKQINTAKKVWYQDEATLVLSLSNSFQVINLQELLYCESDKGYTTFYLNNNKKYVASKPLKEYEGKLKKVNFTRPHQSFMVNLKFIDKYDKSGIIFLKNGQRIPVSSRKKEAFISTFLEYNSH
ncbi:LytR/AlgR family response regulator transcription factor [Flagellimonas nanhaiensis]|uniref:DNA-binding response regulator n=1 Tax=Flagellimonas nanhaiensis TaxID=2292706 RepID=A0A371JVZ1_9FLAO|nr:LytTR family DNA-binding domain-containing protein [Allomuricauda nanhaiensis]RDY61967.1 DNA-binding response regulator [Allomuricauda nanhaiensis]